MNETEIMLRIQKLIAEKLFITALANRDTERGGWINDYTRCQNKVNSEIEDLFGKLRLKISQRQ